MRVIAIDPGPKQGAIVKIDGFGAPLWAAKVPSEEIADALRTLSQDPPFVVACEHLQCFGMAVGAEVFETAYWIGQYREICFNRFVSFNKVLRSEVKLHLCRSARAKDGNIRQAIIDRFGGNGAIGTKKAPGPLYAISGDMWSALAVGITFTERQTQPNDEKTTCTNPNCDGDCQSSNEQRNPDLGPEPSK